jgi:hypothetical protein
VVKIDTVYQTVLALANKEQRGYITPQEFNLFANQAQAEIFEQYFFDLYQFKRVSQNNNEATNPVDFIDEKLDLFRIRGVLSSDVGVAGGDNNDSTFELPENHYRTISVNRRNNSGNGATICQRVEWNDYHGLISSPLLRPHDSRPIYTVYQDGSNRIVTNPSSPNGVEVFYIRKPNIVSWGYMLQNNNALWNPNTSVDFELHSSEQNRLVLKILKLAGISIRDTEISQLANQQEVANIQQQKS